MKTYFAFARAVNLIKIGQSSDPRDRVHNLNLASPVPVELVGLCDHNEAWLHTKFAHLRARNEWFHAAPELVAFVEAECETSLGVAPAVAARPYNPLCAGCGARGHIATSRACPNRHTRRGAA
jgi:hypothetical protein